MKELKLKLATRTIVGYRSFGDAVRHNQGTPRSAHARATSQQISGKSIMDGCWNDDHFALLLSDNLGLHFSAFDEEIRWELITSTRFAEYRSCWASDPERIRLTRHRRSDNQEIMNEMDRFSIMLRIKDKQLRRLLSNEFGVHLHFKGDRRYLSLHASTRLMPELPFLEWFEDED